jgi:phage shock protein A
VGFFARISDLLSANVNDLLDRAEDPEKMVKLLVVEMEEHVETARQGVTKAIAGEKQLETNLQKNRHEAEQWQAKAKSALDRGDEDLARKCLQRKKDFERIADSLLPQWEVARRTSDALKADYRRLEEKLEEARRKRDVLIARKLAAEAQKEVAGVAPAITKAQQSFSKFDRMESKIEQMEAEAKAILELSTEHNDLGREVESLQRQAEVDDELAAMKAEIKKAKEGNS